MSKRTRQYIGLLCAVIAYYLIHEGAHLLYAVSTGVFKQIIFMGLGIQIDIYADKLTQTQLGIFCLVGAAASQIAAYIMVLMTKPICRSPSKVFKACCYYITIALLLLDPVYLSVLCSFFGGGDMNGIALLVPEMTARIAFGALLILNGLVFWKSVLPRYTESFHE
ncbi:MAG: hypothetical protein IJA67_04920 [Oscillospiraceae bacterium]|nr:hypothetical protein [Oscillospiraceae bacterium]